MKKWLRTKAGTLKECCKPRRTSALRAAPGLRWVCGLALLLLISGCAGKDMSGFKAAPKAAAAPQSASYAQSAQHTDGFFLPGGSRLDENALAARLAEADFILIGERHNSARDHQMQAQLLRLVARTAPSAVIGLEMLPRIRHDAQLKRFIHGNTDMAALPQLLDWEKEWGFDFALYEPVFAAAKAHGLPLYGLNIDNELRKKVAKRGIAALSAAEKKRLPRHIALPLSEQRAMLAQVFAAHPQFAPAKPGVASAKPGATPAAKDAPLNTPGTATLRVPVTVRGTQQGRERPVVIPLSIPFERFMLVQSLWDSTMAEQAQTLRQSAGTPVVILAGVGHVEKGYGIAYRLRLLDPAARIIAILPTDNLSPSAQDADLFFYSPQPEARRGYGMGFERNSALPTIAFVVPGSRANKAGMQKGDVIREANGQSLRSAMDLHLAARTAAQNKKDLVLVVERAGKRVRLSLPPESGE